MNLTLSGVKELSEIHTIVWIRKACVYILVVQVQEREVLVGFLPLQRREVQGDS